VAVAAGALATSRQSLRSVVVTQLPGVDLLVATVRQATVGATVVRNVVPVVCPIVALLRIVDHTIPTAWKLAVPAAAVRRVAVEFALIAGLSRTQDPITAAR
jgi:hypothetical protein